MPEAEIYQEMDSCLAKLRDQLPLIRALLAVDRRTEGLAQRLADLAERASYQERALRPRFGLKQAPRQQARLQQIAILEQKGLAVEQTPALTLKHLRDAQELARSMEQSTRFFNLPDASEFYRRLRHELAEVDRRASAVLGAQAAAEAYPRAAGSRSDRVRHALLHCPLYFILDQSLSAQRDPLRIALDAVSGGVRMLQLRYKDVSSRELLDLARRVKTICAEREGLLIVDDRVDVALLAGADGVHVGAEDLSPPEVRRLAPELIIGATARRAADAVAAKDAGADYIGAGSVYPSPTKRGLPVIGVAGIRSIAAAVSIPVVGIGGINLDNCQAVIGAGASGFCSVSPFASRRSVRNLVVQLRRIGRGERGTLGETPPAGAAQ